MKIWIHIWMKWQDGWPFLLENLPMWVNHIFMLKRLYLKATAWKQHEMSPKKRTVFTVFLQIWPTLQLLSTENGQLLPKKKHKSVMLNMFLTTPWTQILHLLSPFLFLLQVYINQLLHKVRQSPFCGQHRVFAHGAHSQAAAAARRSDLWD